MSPRTERLPAAHVSGGPVAWLCLLLGTALAVIAIVTPLPLQAQWLFGLFGFAIAWLCDRFTGRRVTLTLMALSLVVSARYVCFRLGSTLPTEWSLDLVLSGFLLLAELYSCLMLLLGYWQTAWPLQRRPVALPDDRSRWPTVDIFIPTFNEPLRVVAPTVLAARALEWPSEKLRVYLLDDGCRAEFRAFAQEAGVEYFERVESEHAKAGNINKALPRTAGEFIVIFDCDHVPARSFLKVALGWLVKDARIGMVQLPHHFYSPDPFERNLSTFRSQPNEGELFYGLIQQGNDLWNAAFFCGSSAAIRRTALESVGGIAVETVTEDAHTALRIQRQGYDTAYLDVRQIGGLATESLSAHVGQRQRWARGMAQIFRLDNPLLGRGLTFAQRLCYSAAMLHFFHAVPRLIFLLSPLSYLLLGAQILRASPALVLAYALPHLLHSTLTNSRIQGRFRYSFWSEVYETCLSPFTALPTTMALFAPRVGTFNVTAKGGQVEDTYFDRKIALPHLALIGLNVIGLGFGGYQLYTNAPHPDVTLLNMIWVGYNLLILGTVLAVAREAQQRRQVPRVQTQLRAALRLPGAHMRVATTCDLSIDGGLLTVDKPDGIEPGAELSLCLLEPRLLAIPATVLSRTGKTVRLRFAGLSLEQEAALVEGVFSRSDVWQCWDRGRKRDRPLLQALRIGLYGVRGLAFGLLSPFSRRGGRG